MDGTRTASHRGAWNKGKLVGQKAPFKLQEIWAIRIRLQMQGRLRELALFDFEYRLEMYVPKAERKVIAKEYGDRFVPNAPRKANHCWSVRSATCSILRPRC